MMLPGGVAVNSVRFKMESWNGGCTACFRRKNYFIRTTIATLPPNVNFARNSGFIETVKCRELMPQRRG